MLFAYARRSAAGCGRSLGAGSVAADGSCPSVVSPAGSTGSRPVGGQRGSFAPESVEKGAVALGLVHSTTTPTAAPLLALAGVAPSAGVFQVEIDRLLTRARRMKKSVITGARLHEQEAQQKGLRGRWAMLTLTYRDGCGAGAGDVSRLLDCLCVHFRRATAKRFGFKRSGLRFLWVLELTKRLRPHYHLLCWLPTGISLPMPDKRGWWPHGLTRIEWARNAVGYLAKYASKFTADTAGHMPKGMRTHSVGGLDSESKRELRWWKAPTEARGALGELADIRKSKGGYFDKQTGEFWPSPWHCFFTGDGRLFAWREV